MPSSQLCADTLRRWAEKLELVAHFPNRPPVVIEHLVDKAGSVKEN